MPYCIYPVAAETQALCNVPSSLTVKGQRALWLRVFQTQSSSECGLPSIRSQEVGIELSARAHETLD